MRSERSRPTWNRKGTGSEDVDWIQIPQDVVQRQALVNTAMNHRVPQKARNLLSS